MPQLIDHIKRLERRILSSEDPVQAPKTEGEWIDLVRRIDRTFNAGFCHSFKRPKYTDADKEQILALRSHVLKLVEDCG